MSTPFEVIARSSNCEARAGRIQLRSTMVDTPVFMPVGTLGLVKGLDSRDLDALGVQISLANAYHLMLRPGDETVARLGGVHKLGAAKQRAILTDSGGFQVYSLAAMRKITDEGVTFRSHIDGSKHELTPERLVEVQENLFPDIAMVLDECPPAGASRADVVTAVRRTTAWARRARMAARRPGIAWFGIVQGGLFEDLRAAHIEELAEIGFDGFAIGGVSVGEDSNEIERIVDFTAPRLPSRSPRYLMGVGTPADLVRGVRAGVDMFDCVMPARNARNGMLFTTAGRYQVKLSGHRASDEPIDSECSCYTCQNFSRGALRHLFMCRELSYYRLATLHNLWFYMNLMREIRLEIKADCFDPEEWIDRLV